MPLKRWHSILDIDLPYLESPFFAVSKVRHLLESNDASNLDLGRLSEDSGQSYMYDKEHLYRCILQDIEYGRLCLILDFGMGTPFSPFAEWTGTNWRLSSSALRHQYLSGSSKIAQLNARGLTPTGVYNARWSVGRVRNAASPSRLPERSPVIEPRFHIVRTSGSREQIKQRLFLSTGLTPDIEAMFERLNPHLGDYLLPGDMVVLADPHSQECREDEEFLMAEAVAIQGSLHSLEPAQRQSMMDHWQAYEDIALAGEASETSAFSNTSSVIGATSAAGGHTIKEAQQALEEVERLHQQAMDPTNPMTRQQFHSLRDQSLKRLKLAMGNWVNAPLRLPRHSALKSRIQIEARQQLHSVATARKGGKFQIPTISEAITKTTLVAKMTSIGGFIGLSLDVAATQSTVERACSDGRELECTRVKYSEYGGLIGRTAVSALGGGAGGTSGAKICLAVSLSPQGRLVCGIIGAAAGYITGEKAGNSIGRATGKRYFVREYGHAQSSLSD